MPDPQTKTGFIAIDNAKIYYETAGKGKPLVMIHAGVADRRQWDNEFAYFAQSYQVVRYDMRGYGKSEPAIGEFSHMGDLVSLLNSFKFEQSIALMGCSIGGSLALDFVLTYPSKVNTLIMVASGPNGLELDVDSPVKFVEAEKASEVGDLDLVAEIETQIWFDGIEREPEQINQEMRRLLYEMNHIALSHEVKELGNRLPNLETPSFERLTEIDIPVLVIVGANDIPYMLAAADFMFERIPSVEKMIIQDAAHLPNMDQPQEFQRIVKAFLERPSASES